MDQNSAIDRKTSKYNDDTVQHGHMTIEYVQKFSSEFVRTLQLLSRLQPHS